MGNVSPIAEPVRVPIEIPVRPGLLDHRFDNRPVYPAVEAMEILAGAVRRCRPDAPVETLTRVRFEKFLPVPENAATIPVFCELQPDAGGGLAAALLSRTRLPSGFCRNKIHAAAVFEAKRRQRPGAGRGVPAAAGGNFRLSAERLYRELVPFGPGFQSLTGAIDLFEGEVRAVARCPAPEPASEGLLGDSYILDGGFHAACAWGQRFAGIVAFPVGIDRRRILQPTRRGALYEIRVVPNRTEPDMLVFTIDIFDDAGRLRERSEGVRMRDVSGGRWKSPEWIQATASAFSGPDEAEDTT
jgi:hypothetical protein